MTLVWIALRNLARNRRRTAISLAVVAAGTIGILLTAGFIQFSFAGLSEAIVSGGLGHLEVVPAETVGSGATMERSAADGLEDWQALQAEIERQDHVVAASPTVHLMGMASVYSGTGEPDSASFLGVGIDPAREAEMGFEVKLRAGRELSMEEPGDGAPGEALVALGLAETLDVEPGDLLTLLAMTPDGMLNALDVEVVGLMTTGVQDLDTRFLKLHRGSAQRLLQTERVSNLIVGLDSIDLTDAVGSDLRQTLADRTPELAVVGWEERAPYYEQVQNLYVGIFWFLGSIIFVLVVLSASNTLVMAVMERLRELGTLRAIGTSRRQVATMVFAEALWLGLFGALLGSAVGVVLIVLINSLQLKMPPPPGAVDPIDLQLSIVPEAIVGSVVLMLLVLALAALAPIARAVRLKIVEALGHV